MAVDNLQEHPQDCAPKRFGVVTAADKAEMQHPPQTLKSENGLRKSKQIAWEVTCWKCGLSAYEYRRIDRFLLG